MLPHRLQKQLGRMSVAGAAAFVAVVGVAAATDAPVRGDAAQLEPPTVRLSEVAVDPGYSRPTPAPSEPAWKDSTDRYRGLLHACGARMTQCGETCSIRWRELMGVDR